MFGELLTCGFVLGVLLFRVGCTCLRCVGITVYLILCLNFVLS